MPLSSLAVAGLRFTVVPARKFPPTPYVDMDIRWSSGVDLFCMWRLALTNLNPTYVRSLGIMPQVFFR